MPDTNFVQNLIGYIYEWANPLFMAWLPWLGVLIGLALVFIFGRGLIDFIQDKFFDFSDRDNPDIVSSSVMTKKERNERKRYFEDDDIVSREEIPQAEKNKIAKIFES